MSCARRPRVAWLVVVAALLLEACNKPYRVGEYVWVDWDGRSYPAYVLDQKGSRFRVHYEGYDARWDEDVTLDRIRGRVESPVLNPPPPPDKVAAAAGVTAKASGSTAPSSSAAPNVSPYKVGDRVRVRWRGSVYSAVVVEVVDSGKLKVHYDGHEAAWDEKVELDRIVGRR